MDIGGIMGLAKALREAYSPVSSSEHLQIELNGQVLKWTREEIPGFVTKLVNLVQKRDFFSQRRRCVCVCGGGLCSQLNRSFFLTVGYYR